MADQTHVVLSVAQTVSFALPSPAGPFVAAGLQLLDMLAPKPAGPDPTKIILEGLTALGQDIKDFLTTQKLDDVSADISTISDFVAQAKNLLALTEDESVRQIHYNDALKRLEPALALNNFAEKDLEKLIKVHGTGDNAYEIGCTAVQLYLNILMSYICLLKLRCEYANKIADFVSRTEGGAPKALIDEAFAKLDDFWTKLNYWTTGDKPPTDKLQLLTDWCARIKSDRLALIGPVQSGGHDGYDYWTREPNSFAYEYFMDGSREGGRQNHTWKWTYKQIGRRRDKFPEFSDSRAMVERERSEYYNAQQRQMEIDFAYVAQTIQKIREQAEQLSKPVNTATSAPTLGTRDTGWDGAWKHQSGTKVSYGIDFASGKQKSEEKWSDEIDAPTAGRVCPSVTLPVASAGDRQTVRHLYRKLRQPNSDNAPELLVATLDNTTTAFVDLDPSDWSKVCPNAISPPLIHNWQRQFKTANAPDPDAPSWAPGFKVRYRYVYMDGVGQSLAKSPWSQLDIGFDVCDAEGYCTPADRGYLAELKIPKPPKGKATCCKVYRQFAGKPELEIPGTVEDGVTHRDFVFKDTSL